MRTKVEPEATCIQLIDDEPYLNEIALSVKVNELWQSCGTRFCAVCESQRKFRVCVSTVRRSRNSVPI